MQVILLQNMEGLGRKGDQVAVSNGYGRNHLLPYHKALLATPDALSRLGSMKKKFDVEEAKLVTELKGVASKLDGLQVELTMRATAEGHLFGSVSSHVLVDALKAKGYAVAERDIRIKEPIKMVGTFVVPIHLHADVKIAITVVVNAEGVEAAPAATEATAVASAPAEGATASAPATSPGS